MSDGTDDTFNERAADLVLETNEQYQENRHEQQALLDDVAEEEGAEVLETTCSIKGHSVDVSAKLNGKLLDKMGQIDDRLERLEQEEGRAYEFGETADEVAQLLADATDDPALHKGAFYKTYEDHGLSPLGALLEEVFDALQAEQERRQGSADGFREK